MPTNKNIEVVAAVIFDADGRIFAPNELQSVQWLPADKDLIEELACSHPQ